ncbi:MAG: hypothetical protein KA438_07470 [Aliarcobacter sp.]|jgi:uncharacterized membrane protein YeaQ/YmgE (transglycosylase-associated protein family)|nr:hypothetical protein [Aliarcobacter sp.]MBP6713399.1 hypothetical protein [Aliarcobacter sp.]MBP7226395.1 hypothetical protein [Aliarcobacter sp.]MDX9961506.1 hypothetical protein [Aliarcobacter sp.]
MKLKKIVLATCILGIVGANAADSNSAKHYGFSAVFGFTSETLIHKNFTSLNDIERVSYATILGSTPGLIKELTDDKFSNEDMAFNIAGALTGALLSNYLNNNTSIFISHNEEEKATKINLAYNF